MKGKVDLNGERCRICGSKETTVLANASCKCHSTCHTSLILSTGHIPMEFGRIQERHS